MKIGLIGFGRFGHLLFQQISTTAAVTVFDPAQSRRKEYKNIPFVSLPRVCDNELVILAVPVRSVPEISQRIVPYVRAGCVVMDVCAVKIFPLQILEKYLPDNVYILGSHPLFGPDSVQNSLHGHIMIVTPRRIPETLFTHHKKFWSDLGIEIVEMSADKQDRLMAWSLALTHFLGRSLSDLPLADPTVSTRDFQNLIALIKKINRDTWELFEDMHRFNPYTREMRQRLLAKIQDVKEKLDRFNDSDIANG